MRKDYHLGTLTHIVTHVHLKFIFKPALHLSTLAIKLINSCAKIFQTAIATATL